MAKLLPNGLKLLKRLVPPKAPALAKSYDYIVAGAGSAGCLLANELSASGDASVLVVEAGGWDSNPLVHIPAGATRAEWQSQSIRGGAADSPALAPNPTRNWVAPQIRPPGLRSHSQLHPALGTPMRPHRRFAPCIGRVRKASHRAQVYTVFKDPSVNWNFESEPEPGCDGRRVELPRGKVVGGSSSINAMVYMRGHPHDYDAWADRHGLADWSFADCLPRSAARKSPTSRGDAAAATYRFRGDESRRRRGRDADVRAALRCRVPHPGGPTPQTRRDAGLASLRVHVDAAAIRLDDAGRTAKRGSPPRRVEAGRVIASGSRQVLQGLRDVGPRRVGVPRRDRPPRRRQRRDGESAF